MSIIQALYDSSINVKVYSEDAPYSGWSVVLGDPSAGLGAVWGCKDWDEVEETLQRRAIEFWPDSSFAAAFLKPRR